MHLTIMLQQHFAKDTASGFKYIKYHFSLILEVGKIKDLSRLVYDQNRVKLI
jgi:hypothetical protein